MTPEMQTLVEYVKVYAQLHYNTGGWDYCIECMDDAEIARIIGTATGKREALSKVNKIVKIMDDKRKDIQATAF